MSKETIFGNPVSTMTGLKAKAQKEIYGRVFGFDPTTSYDLSAVDNPVMSDLLGIKDIQIGSKGEAIDTERGVLLGTIRMGYGHYRISMALASAARHKGLTPYWFDLLAFEETTGAKVIHLLETLYSFGSRLSQKVEAFNKLVWEPLNSEGFKNIAQYANDKKTAELMTSVYRKLPKNMPFISSHAWTAQAAIAAGMQRVVAAVCDNWPMALHLAEGAIHAVQSESSWLGYRILREMGEEGQIMQPIPENQVVYTGHYVDHELVANIEQDCEKRLNRIRNKQERRLLFSIGGAGAQLTSLVDILQYLKQDIEQERVTIFINSGDHESIWNGLQKEMPELAAKAKTHFDDFSKVIEFAGHALENPVKGVHVFRNKDIYSAVYTTNLLMRCSDILVTKPSELAFYPVPKLFIKRVGGHEMWGAIRAAELGDGTIECGADNLLKPTLDILLKEDGYLYRMCENIVRLKQIGVYDGAYKAIDLACNAK